MQSYKTFRGTHRIKTAVATAFSFPAFGFAFFLASVIAEHAVKSSAALPYLEFAKVLVIWFGVSVPLVIIGSILGFLKRISDTRIHTNIMVRTVHKKVCRSILPSSLSALPPLPPLSSTPLIFFQVWYQRPLFSILFAGVLPFGVMVIEYFFVLYSLWDKPIYDSYRYLLVSLVSLFITSASTNLVACFYQLNSGDPQWWWRVRFHFPFFTPLPLSPSPPLPLSPSLFPLLPFHPILITLSPFLPLLINYLMTIYKQPFLHGAASAVYMMIYSTVILFASFKLQTAESFILYFSFTLFASSLFFLLTSSVGFAACYFFVQTIYKHVHLLPVN